MKSNQAAFQNTLQCDRDVLQMQSNVLRLKGDGSVRSADIMYIHKPHRMVVCDHDLI